MQVAEQQRQGAIADAVFWEEEHDSAQVWPVTLLLLQDTMRLRITYIAFACILGWHLP